MSKQHKIDEINLQLEILQQQMLTLTKLSKESSQQFESIKKFGIQQSSFFMSSHAIFQKLTEENEKKDS